MPSTSSLLQTTKILIIALALSVGMSYVFAWTGPTQTAPAGNVSAPINAGTVAQTKLGQFSIAPSTPVLPAFDVTGVASVNGLLVNGAVTITGTVANPPAAGKVLTAVDDTGFARWQTPAAGGSGGAVSCDASPFVASMTSGTTYQNTSGTQLIVVSGGLQPSSSISDNLAAYISSTNSFTSSNIVAQDGYSSTNRTSVTFVVPPGYWYKVVNNSANGGSITSQAWKVCGGTSSGVSSIIAGTGVTVSSTGTSGTGDVTVSASGTNLVDTVVYTRDTRVTPNEKNLFSIYMDDANIATGHYGGTDSQGDLTDVFIMNFTFNKVTGMFSYALDSNQIGSGNSGSINIVNSEFSVNTNPLANAKTYFYARYDSSTKRLRLAYKTGYNSSFSVFANTFAR